ncbi:hypothetical protein ACW0JT_08525 [Arthrobacter sp. SA17]
MGVAISGRPSSYTYSQPVVIAAAAKATERTTAAPGRRLSVTRGARTLGIL